MKRKEGEKPKNGDVWIMPEPKQKGLF